MFTNKKSKKKVRRRRKKAALRERAVRFLSLSAKVLAVLVVVPTLAYGGLKFYNFILTSPELEIKSITVSGTERVGEDEVLKLSTIQKGQNLFSVDKGEAERSIEGHPWVESVSIDRDLPDKIEINITEKRALCLVSLDGLFVADYYGRIFKKYSPGDSLDLPVITGLEGSGVKPEGYMLNPMYVGLINLLSKRKGFNLDEVSEIHIDATHGYSLYTMREGVRLDIGKLDLEEKLRAFERVVRVRGGQLKGMKVVDLNNDRGVVVKLTDKANNKGGGGRYGKKG